MLFLGWHGGTSQPPLLPCPNPPSSPHTPAKSNYRNSPSRLSMDSSNLPCAASPHPTFHLESFTSPPARARHPLSQSGPPSSTADLRAHPSPSFAGRRFAPHSRLPQRGLNPSSRASSRGLCLWTPPTRLGSPQGQGNHLFPLLTSPAPNTALGA